MPNESVVKSLDLCVSGLGESIQNLETSLTLTPSKRGHSAKLNGFARLAAPGVFQSFDPSIPRKFFGADDLKVKCELHEAKI